MENADQALTTARKAYDDGDQEKFTASLAEVGDSVDLAYQSLADSGKDPRKAPAAFKKAEMSARVLLRRIEGLKQAVSFADREVFDPLSERITEVRDNLINGIMSKKKK